MLNQASLRWLLFLLPGDRPSRRPCNQYEKNSIYKPFGVSQFFFKWSSIHEAPPICMIVAFKFPFLLIFQLWLALQGNYIAAIGIILAFFHGEVNTRVNHENGKMSPYLCMSETEKIIQRFNFSIGTYICFLKFRQDQSVSRGKKDWMADCSIFWEA